MLAIGTGAAGPNGVQSALCGCRSQVTLGSRHPVEVEITWLEWPTRQCDAGYVVTSITRHWGHSCFGGRMGDKGEMTWRKSVEGRAAMLERRLDNETHPFNGIVGAIGEPNGMEDILVT